ncbi:ribonuclease H2, subunit C [Lactarius akahatsu]|uniref:Ribonuclease H2, subunit C n=1 Tax=Lactarius akahatsu TaxID=416441 RepID=A0AAD4LDF8_9AGAM|nr:ribonuclease H2, subunit C [Lactarius akahatsu]
MPFHIQHSGPAPVSTYFRIQPAPLPESHPCPPSVAIEAQLVSTTTVVVTPEEKENASVVSVVATSTSLATATAEIKAEIDPVIKPPLLLVRPGPIERISGSAKRFISSFRGRTVHGVEASLPKGYSGIVLRGDAEGRTQTTTGKAKRQPARKLRSQLPDEVPEDNMAGILPPEEERPVRVLKPSARFDSFVLWHPDIPVDEEMDEYLRSLSEWVNIASKIHESEALPT